MRHLEDPKIRRRVKNWSGWKALLIGVALLAVGVVLVLIFWDLPTGSRESNRLLLPFFLGFASVAVGPYSLITGKPASYGGEVRYPILLKGRPDGDAKHIESKHVGEVPLAQDREKDREAEPPPQDRS